MKMNHNTFVLMMAFLFALNCQIDGQQNVEPTDNVVEQKRQQLLRDPDFQQYLKFEALQIQRIDSDYYNDSKLNHKAIQSKMAEKTGLTSEERIAIYEANGMINAKEFEEQSNIGFYSLRRVFKKYPELKEGHLFIDIMSKIKLTNKFD